MSKVKSTLELIEEGLACPTCGATWSHKHSYPGNIGGGYWIWEPPSAVEEIEEMLE
jgi:hypothetical protein